jgi:hypothetical protein
MRAIFFLKSLLIISAALVVLIYFLYRTNSWPLGLEALECLIAFLILVASVFFVEKFRNILSKPFEKRNIIAGLYIGILWTLEISMNNIIQPGLPLRDNLDDIFWAIIACLILYLSISSSFKTKKIFDGIKAGVLSGFSTGVIACFTALILIVFGMRLIESDAINKIEWLGMKDKSHYPNMAAYFAYETLAGAIMHLVILGLIMGLLLGIIGGTAGKLFALLKK